MDYSDTTVVIPTLNERENIPHIVSAILKSYRGIRIIVADDGSNDGTTEIVKSLQKENSRVSLLDRKSKPIHGITASVIDAAFVCKTKKLIVMDADMQHPVEKVGTVSNLLSKCDIVVAVRKSIRDWPLYRRIISRLIAYFTYFVFVLRRKRTCNDIMSGFFGIRTDLFRRLALENKGGFIPKGYKVLVDILRLCGRESKIMELPYTTFHKRSFGHSKLGAVQLYYVILSTLK